MSNIQRTRHGNIQSIVSLPFISFGDQCINIQVIQRTEKSSNGKNEVRVIVWVEKVDVAEAIRAEYNNQQLVLPYTENSFRFPHANLIISDYRVGDLWQEAWFSYDVQR